MEAYRISMWHEERDEEEGETEAEVGSSYPSPRKADIMQRNSIHHSHSSEARCIERKGSSLFVWSLLGLKGADCSRQGADKHMNIKTQPSQLWPDVFY